MRTTAAAPLVLVLVLAVTGCTPPAPPAAEPEPSPVVTETEAPASPTPTPTEEGPEPDFGFTFLRDSVIGTDFATAGVTGLADCPWYSLVENNGGIYTHAMSYPEAPGAEILFFFTQLVTFEGGTAPLNSEGVGLGATVDELLAVYPDAVIGSSAEYGGGPGAIVTVTVDDPDSESKYVFGFRGGSSATSDMVQWGPLAGGQWSHLCYGI